VIEFVLRDKNLKKSYKKIWKDGKKDIIFAPRNGEVLSSNEIQNGFKIFSKKSLKKFW
jgi:hypothetical protein